MINKLLESDGLLMLGIAFTLWIRWRFTDMVD
jgi:hypothetical protein